MKKIIDEIRASSHQKVKVAITDIDGILRGKYLSKEKFLAIAESSFGFCSVVFGWDSADVCYDNVSYTGWQTGYPDANAKIDHTTYRNIPWDGGVPFFLADFVANAQGAPLEICPRQTLKRVLARANQAGYQASCGMEFEWFNFAETSQSVVEKNWHGMKSLTPGMFGYSIVRMNQNSGYLNALMDQMAEFRVPIEGLHTETGPGVFEAAILYGDALEAADRAVLFKSGAKEIGHRFGVMPTFMAKWNSSLPGCSGHSHQSLWDPAHSKNLFHDDNDPLKMSDLFRSYVAGQLAALPEILPLFAPTINSYKRLVDGYWAPTKVSWGIDNRTVALRVIPGSSKSTRLETRVPGSDVNPYLAVAGCVGAGLYGIQKNLKLTHLPVKGSAYHDAKAERLPRNLMDATKKMADSKIANEIFGEAFVDHFVKTREWEWRQFQDSVTNWELQRYFEII